MARCSPSTAGSCSRADSERSRWAWELLGLSKVDDHTYATVIGEQIVTRQRWRNQYEAAKS
jgi:hypothetical protein